MKAKRAHDCARLAERLGETMLRPTLLLAALFLPALAAAQTMPGHHPGMTAAPMAAMPSQPGQGAFAAIQEIVALLEADPKTDWSKVNIEALRQHLIDMDNVTLHATVTAEPAEGGMRFTVSGTGATRDSIQRMVMAHAATMNGAWRFTAAPTDTGATLLVQTPPADEAKLRALGFIGVMTRGMHHQMHHLMLARGANPHQH